MTDAERVECEFCGDEYKTQGLATHQRFCDDNSRGAPSSTASTNEADEKPDDDGVEEASSRSVIASETLERDGHTCVNCGRTDDLTAHMVDRVEPDRLANRISLCPECHEEFEGLHPLTKRTKAFH